ncbi:dTDP-4-amino-4,6-dideoxygalactose transaminase [Agrobacterium vitis]|nr:dTDP-4-amino-4,6-dideoxygalactose transaminase [Agrobacterium vitis]MBE1436468.1 dTDP-4-amino-4,6-dideoxygalactose transaminase [Agrobacterium vitis]
MTPLFVSKPLLPELSDVYSYIEKIWSSGHVTNHGPLSLQLEERLAGFLKAPTAMLFNNGTAGIFAALKYFDLPPGSEVITTPMTFAATAHAISWNNLRPVFVDISEHDLTIDPEAVAAAVTSNTSAILAVHAYGCICDHAALDKIAKQHNLKLLYDAAHAFGSTLDGNSVAILGDASIFSFHATKLFNTIEGGLITTPHAKDKEGIYLLRNFGIKSEEEVVSIGLNGKMNEMQAAIGLLNLDIFEKERAARSILRARYKEILSGFDGVIVQDVGENATQSEQYFLTRIDEAKFGRNRDRIKADLEKENIFCRKYFYPLCTDYTPYRSCSIVTNKPVAYAETAKMQVLCLPFHSSVSDEHLKIIERVFRA